MARASTALDARNGASLVTELPHAEGGWQLKLRHSTKTPSSRGKGSPQRAGRAGLAGSEGASQAFKLRTYVAFLVYPCPLTSGQPLHGNQRRAERGCACRIGRRWRSEAASDSQRRAGSWLRASRGLFPDMPRSVRPPGRRTHSAPSGRHSAPLAGLLGLCRGRSTCGRYGDQWARVRCVFRPFRVSKAQRGDGTRVSSWFAWAQGRGTRGQPGLRCRRRGRQVVGWSGSPTSE